MELTAYVFQKGRGVNCIYQDYSHKKDGHCNGKKRWRCTVRGCRGKVHTVNEQEDGTSTVVYFNPHDHMANPISLFNNQIKAKLLDFVNQKNNLHLSVEKVYYKYISQTKFEDEPPPFNNCKTIMNRARQSFLKSVSKDTTENYKNILQEDLSMEEENESTCKNTVNDETVYLTEEASSSILTDILVDYHTSSETLPKKNVALIVGEKQTVPGAQQIIELNKSSRSLNSEVEQNSTGFQVGENTSCCNSQITGQTNETDTNNISDNTSITIKDLKTIIELYCTNSLEKQQDNKNSNLNFKSMWTNCCDMLNKRTLNGETENTQTKKQKTNLFQNLPNIPPPPTLSLSLPSEERDHLYSMLTSWYMSGYHSGYYKCFKEHFSQKKKIDIL